MSKVRMNIEVSQDLADFIEQMALHEATSKTEIVRRALSVLKVYKKQKSLGRSHLGFTSKAENLEAELVGILD